MQMANIFRNLETIHSEIPPRNPDEVAISLAEFSCVDKNSNSKYASGVVEATMSQAQHRECLDDRSNRLDSSDTSSANLRLAEDFNMAITQAGSQCALISGHLSVENLRGPERPAFEEGRKLQPTKGKLCRSVIGHWKTLSVQFSDSLYMIPIQIMLLGMMVSLLYMGITYISKCPMSVLIPSLLLFMGVLGTLTVYIRMMFVIYRFLVPTGSCNGARHCTYFVNYLFFIAYVTEMGCYLNSSPSFNDKESNYCSPGLYFYVSWMNWLTLLTMVVVLAIHGPAFLDRLLGRSIEGK